MDGTSSRMPTRFQRLWLCLSVFDFPELLFMGNGCSLLVLPNHILRLESLKCPVVDSLETLAAEFIQV